MSVYFTSDLHLGHEYAAECRGFADVDLHDLDVIDSFRQLTKRDKLFILGDVAFSKSRLQLLGALKCVIEICLGNHDQGKATEYLKYANELRGCYQYKGWLISHFPIHPQELYRCKGNIHGHIHNGAATPPITDIRYCNVNWDWHRGPVRFDAIDSQYGDALYKKPQSEPQ